MTAALTDTPNTAHDRDWRRRVARAFGRAAPHYTRRALAQAQLGEHLWQRLPSTASRIVDLGCGPGDWTQRLTARYGRPALGIDLAFGMLAEARHRHARDAHWLCADATRLPLADGALDLVFSNLAIQWCRNLPALFAELHRVLAPGGVALINTLGPGTLAEVADAWSHPDRRAAVEPFVSAACYRALIRRAGLHGHLTPRVARFHYPDLDAVMASIKGVGAQVARPGARLGRADLVRARARFERHREAAGLPVTYHCLTLELTQPPRNTP
ncbi:methyltransferase domain-containing protein [Modicisalibacter sp. 'Wilcox']|uniref:methyltransferase domain-containing protein n=1 Tax=Modicisalibacter sp. 'Wilcox' TaxID=2679914 RepID=UPI0013D830A1|nr:methyltransferase domain-containing protein [Modicisalibacter sp. 'Wilcox']